MTDIPEPVASARNYWVATMRADGRPHGMPVWGMWLDGAFLFGPDPASTKARHFARSPEVVVHLESGDEAVILEGTVEQEMDSGVLVRFADASDAKYAFRPDLGETAAWRLWPRGAFAWREQDFPQSATRWRFEER